MLQFLARRIVVALLVGLTVLSISFALTRLSGDLAISIAGPNATAEDIAQVRKNYGLDRPLPVQFADWVGHAATGDLGESYCDKASVAGLIGERLPVTLTLGLVGLAIALAVALPLGIVAALHEGTAIDRLASLIAMIGQAMPSFWLGLVLMITLGLKLQWLPISGTGSWENYVMPGVAVGAGIVGLVALTALFAPLLVPHDPFAQDLAHRLVPPAWMEGGQPEHWFGTDQIGRDYLARLIYGARISMLIGLMTVLTSGLIGGTLGILGGYFGGRADDLVLFAITCRLATPLILVALTAVALVGSSLTIVVSTLGLLLWDRFAVVALAATMQVRALDYISAARAARCSPPYIPSREVLPNIVRPLAAVATPEMALAILLEATLSFLGLGVPPPLPSWGLMIAEAKDYMFFSPWVIMIPGAALFLLVLGINLLGDGLSHILGTDRAA